MKAFSSLKIETFHELSSTQLYCTDQIKRGKAVTDLVIARSQTDGQGRKGKHFYSPSGTGSYFSYSLTNASLPVDGITPRIALAVREAIQSLWNVDCGIKWVNDLYLDRRKVCGILAQQVQDYTVIGVGINLAPPEKVPPHLSERMGWLFSSVPSDHNLLPEFVYKSMELWFSEDKSSVLNAYRSACFHIGNIVEVEYDNRKYSGTCIGIDEEFRLLVQTNSGLRSFDSGMVSLSV